MVVCVLVVGAVVVLAGLVVEVVVEDVGMVKGQTTISIFSV